MFDEIEKLIHASSGLPPKHVQIIGPLAICIREKYRVQETLLKKIKVSLTELQTQVKYLVFDLEATRRERDAYKAKLDQILDQS